MPPPHHPLPDSERAVTCAPASTPSTSTSTASPAPAAAYNLDTFPIVRRRDQAAFAHCGVNAMNLTHHNALAAVDATTDVAV